MLFGVLFPWVVNIVDMSRLFGYIYVDSAAMSFGVTGLAFVPALFRYRLLDLTPVAWAAVVDRIDDAVVVIDPRGQIVVLNPAAQRLIGRPTADVVGRPAAQAFTSWRTLARHLEGPANGVLTRFELDGPDTAPARSFDARISMIGEPSDPAGWVLVLRENTCSRRAAAERDRMLREQRRPRPGRGRQYRQGSLPRHPLPRTPHASHSRSRHRHRHARRSRHP